MKRRRVTVRRIPGLTWPSVALSPSARPGHSWMYGGIVRRDTFTLRGRSLVVMFMPAKSASTAAGSRGEAFDARYPGQRDIDMDGATA